MNLSPRLLFLLALLPFAAFAQGPQINGPTNVIVNCATTFTYTGYGYANGPVASPVWQISASGTVISTTRNPDGNVCTATVKWTTVGTGTLTLKDGSVTKATKSVPIITQPTAPWITNGERCGPGTVVLGASPGSSGPGSTVRWYAAQIGGTYFYQNVSVYTTPSLTITTEYWTTTYDVCSGLESTPRTKVTAAVYPVLSAPATSTNATSFINGSVTLSVSPVAGAVSYRWYTVPTGGGAIGGANTTSYVLTVTGAQSYHVSAMSNTICEGTTRKIVSVIVEPDPVITSSNPITVMGSNVTLDAGAGYLSYEWFNVNNPSAILGTQQTFATNIVGDYKVKVTKAGVSYYGISQAFSVLSQFATQNQNYIVDNTPLVAHSDESSLYLLPSDKVSQTIKYFDGLGRPSQTVRTQNSPSGLDLVLPIEYDNLGREVKKFLPYTDGNNGFFKLNALRDPATTQTTQPEIYRSGQQYDFYNSTDKVATDKSPYAESKLEASPLNRVIKQGSAGEAWQPDANVSYDATDKSQKKGYEYNTVTDVLNFDYISPNVNYPMGSIAIGRTVYYLANDLQKDKTKDEQGNEVIVFKNKEGQVLLKKAQVNATTYAQTYYIYDDLGNLVYVLQPESVAMILSTLNITWANKTTNLSIDPLTNALSRTTGAGYTVNASATSTIASETLAAGASGWVETIAEETNKSRTIGLTPINVSGNAINFAMELSTDGNIYRSEGGVRSYIRPYVKGTVIRIAREGSSIVYYVDGVAWGWGSTTSTSSLIVDTAFDQTGGTLKNVNISFKSNTTLPSILSNYAFRYVYDGFKRVVQKQVPGSDVLYMVYDNRDRLVMTQDGNQRSSKQWLFTKYDAFNRSVLTGILKTNTILSQSDMQTRVNTFYSTYTSPAAQYETFTSVAGNVHGYTNNSYPQTDTLKNYLTAIYYDNYDFKALFNSSEFDYKPNELPADAINNYPGQLSGPFNSVAGQATGMKVRSIGGGTFLKSVTYYDDNYKPIQQIADNIKGHTVTTNVYDFTSRVVRTKSSLYLGQPVTWASIVSAQVQGDVITGTNSTAWTGGAVSSQTLAAGADGWMEMKVIQTLPIFAVGLSDVNTNNNYNTIDYALYVNGTTVRPYENGTAKGLAVSVYPGDILRVERVAGTVYYKRNSSVIYTSLTASNTLLMADASFNTSGAKFSGARLSNTFTVPLPLDAASYFVKRYNFDPAGRVIEIWQQTDGPTEILLVKNIYNELGQLIDKKLHSTVSSASDAKQSVDYRYNIRGWMTSINNSTLTNDGINDDTGDYFGLNLLYEQNDASLGSTGLYNGNISGMRWSTNQGLSAIKETGYNFSYDQLNRLTAANSRMNKSNLWQVGYFDENGLSYDLNGNIKTLQRKGDSGNLIDNLTYNYGATTTLSNKLLYVTDGVSITADKIKGFNDGNTSGSDYTYDLNGNMTVDKNKGVTGAITYNYLNLPTKIVRSNSTLQYEHDALGMKLSQLASFGSTQKNTEYVGPWIFENNELQFIQHDEGRIVVQCKKTKYVSSGDGYADMTPTSNVTLSSTTINGEKYVQVTPAVGSILTKAGISVFGSAYAVTEGERYTIRVKGYNNSSTVANIVVKGNTADLLWPGASLPFSVVNESWIESSFIIPFGVTQITIGIGYNSGGTATASHFFLINDVELYKQTKTGGEYQYHLKDHLGNIRLTFTTKDETTAPVATMETANAATEQTEYLYYNEAIIINQQWFDHTNQGPTYYSTRLTGGTTNAKYGLAKSLSVMPGDVISMEAYGKYLDTDNSHWSTAMNNFLTSIANGTAPAGTFVDGGGAGSIGGGSYPFPPIDHTGDPGVGPMAYINYVVFNKDMTVMLNSGYKRISDTPKENGQDVAHERMAIDNITITEPGYVYVYLSNENPTYVEVYFDDFKVTHTKSPVIQTDDYYPFGLTFNSYSRENSVKQDYLYNSMELQDELNLKWYDYGWRQYDPAIGRFLSVDPAADLMRRFSPYAYAFDNPIRFTDPDGMVPDDRTLQVTSSKSSDQIKETNTTSNTTTRTVDPSSKEYIALLGKSTITGDGANGIGQISVVTTTTVSTETTTNVEYDESGNETSRNTSEVTTTTTKEAVVVKDQMGGTAGGAVETKTNSVTSNSPQVSKEMSSITSAAVGYRAANGMSITNRDEFAGALKSQAEITKAYNAITSIGGLLAGPLVSKIPALGGAKAGLIGVPIGIVGAGLNQGLKNLEYKSAHDPCNNCTKYYDPRSK
jgi:RHS repeat-associated protein